jgi:hypothetical protein
MKYAIGLIALLSLAGSASAGEGCAPLTERAPLLGPLGQIARDAAARMDPEIYEQRRQKDAQRATYKALLAAGAPESTACAAAVNPQVLQAIAPIYFGHPSR